MSSRKRIRYGVPVIPVIIFLLFLCFSFFANTFADDSNYYNLFHEGFEDSFPPEGWKFHKTNIDHTWEKVDYVENGDFYAYEGDWFIYVKGPSYSFYNEILITTKITLNPWDACSIEGDIACDIGYDTLDDFDFRVYISYDYTGDLYSSTWIKVESRKGGSIHCGDTENGDPWKSFSSGIYDFKQKDFWLLYQYTGTAGTGVALEGVCVSCDSNQQNPPGNDDDDDDDDNNDDNIINDNMAGNSKNADGDDKDDKGCGFARRTFDPAAPLALFMVMVGTISLFFSRKYRTQKRKR